MAKIFIALTLNNEKNKFIKAETGDKHYASKNGCRKFQKVYTGNKLMICLAEYDGQKWIKIGYTIVNRNLTGGAHPWGASANGFNTIAPSEESCKQNILDFLNKNYSDGSLPFTFPAPPSSQETAKKAETTSNAAESSLSPAKLPAMPEYSDTDELKDIYDLAKNIFDNVRNNEEINKYAVGYPILWFGNLEAYRKSTIKILTVGINPSEDEFPNNTFRRFPAWNELSVENYFKGLNEYFNEEAYNWFTQLSNSISFDEIWNCSYITDQRQNTALHVDFCTPIATNPTWSNGLPANVQSYLQEIQIDYFQRLLAFLNPDIVFIGSKQCESWQTLNVLKLLISCEYKNNSPEVSSLIEKLTTLKGKPHNNRGQLRCLKSTHGAFVITGQYRNRPFAVYAQKRLRPIMAAIKKYYSNKFKK